MADRLAHGNSGPPLVLLELDVGLGELDIGVQPHPTERGFAHTASSSPMR